MISDFRGVEVVFAPQDVHFTKAAPRKLSPWENATRKCSLVNCLSTAALPENCLPKT